MTHPTIHLSGDLLILTFPPAGSETRTHEVRIPLDRCAVETGFGGQPIASQRGWSCLLSVLRERERAERAPTIATPAAPNFHQVERALAGDKILTTVERALHAKKYDSRGTLGEPAKVPSEVVRDVMRKVGLI